MLPVIESTNPTVIAPVVEEIRYDKWWIKNVNLRFPSETKAGGQVTFQKYRVLADGSKEFTEELVTIMLPNLWERAMVDNAFAQVMGGVVLEINKLGMESGKL